MKVYLITISCAIGAIILFWIIMLIFEIIRGKRIDENSKQINNKLKSL